MFFNFFKKPENFSGKILLLTYKIGQKNGGIREAYSLLHVRKKIFTKHDVFNWIVSELSNLEERTTIIDFKII